MWSAYYSLGIFDVHIPTKSLFPGQAAVRPFAQVAQEGRLLRALNLQARAVEGEFLRQHSQVRPAIGN